MTIMLLILYLRHLDCEDVKQTHLQSDAYI